MKKQFIVPVKDRNSTTIKENRVKVKLIALAFLLIGCFPYNPIQAQVNVNVNIGSQAVWGPVGYDYVEYYYLPEADAFYYVSTGEFIYWSGPRQVTATYLPASYHINLYSTYKVVVNEPKPYLQHNTYIVKYGKYKKGGPKQNIIRDSHDQKYYAVKGHPKHGNGNGNGNIKNNGGSTKSSGNKSNQSVGSKGKASNNNNSQPGHGGKSKGGHQNGGKSGGGKSSGGHKK